MRNVPFLIMAPTLAATVVSGHYVYAEDFLTVPQAQQALFADASSFTEAPIALTDDQREQIKKIAGVGQRQAVQKAWRVENNGALLGWFMVDDVIGKHDFITYAAAISAQGKVLGIEILSYRETHGGQVRQANWRQNFSGKTLADGFKLGKDIPNISGATLSCRNVTDGVKRLLAVHQVALKT